MLGIPFIQGHAPFSFRDNTLEGWKTHNYPRLVRAIEIAGVLGIRELIIHPVQFLPYKQNAATLHAYNMEFYRALAPTAKEAGIKIALENMFVTDPNRKIFTESTCGDPREFVDYLDTLAVD